MAKRDRAAEDAALREEIRDWVRANWDPDLLVEQWWELVGEAGWTAPHLPPEHGGLGKHRRSAAVVREVFAQEGAFMPPGGLGLLMAAPTILAQGTPEQIERHVKPILTGKLNWCQLFSEPGNGSDLAGLTTRAERDGDRWIINGQKVWSSMAAQSDYGMLLARTNFDVPKHEGISWFAFRMDQPGVTIRPLREMTGEAVFNEVFLDDVVCDDTDLIGGEGNGWQVTQATLFFERTGLGSGAHSNWPEPGPKVGFITKRAGDAAAERQPVNDMVVRYPTVAKLARAQQRTEDPFVRQDLARLHTNSRISAWNADRAKAEAASGGGAAIANLGKVIMTGLIKDASSLAIDILGAEGMLAAPDGQQSGRFTSAFVFSPASSIYGGTDEIQRNIVAERVLGLPREDLPGKGQPYGEVLRSINQAESARRQAAQD